MSKKSKQTEFNIISVFSWFTHFPHTNNDIRNSDLYAEEIALMIERLIGAENYKYMSYNDLNYFKCVPKVDYALREEVNYQYGDEIGKRFFELVDIFNGVASLFGLDKPNGREVFTPFEAASVEMMLRTISYKVLSELKTIIPDGIFAAPAQLSAEDNLRPEDMEEPEIPDSLLRIAEQMGLDPERARDLYINTLKNADKFLNINEDDEEDNENKNDLEE